MVMIGACLYMGGGTKANMPYHISGQSCENTKGETLPLIAATVRRAILPSLVKLLNRAVELVLP